MHAHAMCTRLSIESPGDEAIPSLASRPLSLLRRWPGTHCLRMRLITQQNLGIRKLSNICRVLSSHTNVHVCFLQRRGCQQSKNVRLDDENSFTQSLTCVISV